MPIKEEMQSLAQEIIRAYEGRIRGIAQIRETARADREIAKNELKGFQYSRIAMGRELKAELAESVADRRAGVRAMLKEFNSAHNALSQEMKAELARASADRRREVGAMLQGFRSELTEVGSALAGAREAWQKLTATMQVKRGVAVAVVEPPEVAPELRDRVFAYLADHPDGTRMTELEKEFDLSRIQMSRLLKSLMEENKVVKQELLYFAV